MAGLKAAAAEIGLTRWPCLQTVIVSGHLPHVDPLTPRVSGRVVMLQKPLTANALAAALGQLAASSEQEQNSARHQL